MVVNAQGIHNQWVILYNKYLCIKFNAHINVEFVAVRSVVKYIYKYVHKGRDDATIISEGNTTHFNSK